MSRELRIGGPVVRGRARGRQLGFPTVNVQAPASAGAHAGVWAGWIRWLRQDWRMAVINVGRRPTFGDSGLSVEAHILDFVGELYGREIELQLVHKLRAEQRFHSVQALVDQISRDIEQTRALFAGRRGGTNPMEDEQ